MRFSYDCFLPFDLGTQPLFAYLPPGDALAHKRSVTERDLGKHEPWVMPENHCSYVYTRVRPPMNTSHTAHVRTLAPVRTARHTEEDPARTNWRLHVRRRLAPLIVVFWLFAAVASAEHAASQPAGTGRIAITIHGFEHTEGQAVCGLFKPAGWLKKAVHNDFRAVRRTKVTCRFDGIPFGRYAIGAFHDEDGDGEMDKFLGIPTEPYAFARNLSPSFSKPSFSEAAFMHDAPLTKLKTTLH